MNSTAATRLIALHVAAIATIGGVAVSVLTNSNSSASSDVADYGTSLVAQHNGGPQ